MFSYIIHIMCCQQRKLSIVLSVGNLGTYELSNVVLINIIVPIQRKKLTVETHLCLIMTMPV